MVNVFTLWAAMRGNKLLVSTVVTAAIVRLVYTATKWLCAWLLLLLEALLVSAALSWVYCYIARYLNVCNNWKEAFTTTNTDLLAAMLVLVDTAAPFTAHISHQVAGLLLLMVSGLLRIWHIIWATNKPKTEETEGTTSRQELSSPPVGIPDAKLAALKQQLREQCPYLNTPPSHDYLERLDIDRASCLAESMVFLPPNAAALSTWRAPLHVKFYGEVGVDASGLKREWVTVVARQLQAACLARTGNEQLEEYFIAPVSSNTPTLYGDLMDTYYWMGLFLAKLLLENNRAWPRPLTLSLPFQLTPLFYKLLMQIEPDPSDIQRMDPMNHKTIFHSLARAQPGSVEALCLAFVYYRRTKGGRTRALPLKPGGAKVAVTDANKHEFQALYMQEMKRSVMEQADRVVEGFRDLLPDAVYEHLKTQFSIEELKLLFEGRHTLNISQLKQSVQLIDFEPQDCEVTWFWGAFSALSSSQQLSVLEYITGCKGLPVLGEGEHVFTLRRTVATAAALAAAGRGGIAVPALPVAHTCSRTLDLPEGCFTSQEQLQRSLVIALEHMGHMGLA